MRGDLSTMGQPLVSEHLRPLLIGRLHLSPRFASLGVPADSMLLGVGCGTGNPLDSLEQFRSDVGCDMQPGVGRGLQ